MATYRIDNLFIDPNFKYLKDDSIYFNARSDHRPTFPGPPTVADSIGTLRVISKGFSIWGLSRSFTRTNSVWFPGMFGGYFSGYVRLPDTTGPAGPFQIEVNYRQNGQLFFLYQSPIVNVPLNTWIRMSTPAMDIPAQNGNSPWESISFAINQKGLTSIVYFETDCWQLDYNTVNTNPTASSVTPYIDGDQPGATWVNPANKTTSASYKVVNTNIKAKAFSPSSGKATIFVPRSKQFKIITGISSSIGKLSLTKNPIPANAFDDFAVAPAGHPDPAMTVVPQGILQTVTDSIWSRAWTRQSAPNAYPIPGGFAWPNATYAAVGAKFTGVTNTKAHYVDLVQLEKGPKAAPLTWEQPRTVNVTVKPNRINWIKNPNFEVNTTGWSSSGSNTPVIARDTTQFKFGTAALKFTLGANPPAWTGVPYQSSAYAFTGLTAGNQYTFSAYILRSPGCPKVFVFPIGQIPAGETTTVNYVGIWERISLSFIASASSMTIGVGINQDEMTAGSAAVFWADGVLCEENTGVGTYFDGSFGVDYLWESSGSPNNSRSFYYQGRRDKTYRLLDILKQNVPLGTPINIIYTQ